MFFSITDYLKFVYKHLIQYYVLHRVLNSLAKYTTCAPQSLRVYIYFMHITLPAQQFLPKLYSSVQFDSVSKEYFCNTYTVAYTCKTFEGWLMPREEYH